MVSLGRIVQNGTPNRRKANTCSADMRCTTTGQSFTELVSKRWSPS